MCGPLRLRSSAPALAAAFRLAAVRRSPFACSSASVGAARLFLALVMESTMATALASLLKPRLALLKLL
eukprot:188513-Alexandrium_andersonii.AAC.1